MREIAPVTLQHLLDQGSELALLDVREPGEYNPAHIPGAAPLPRRLIEQRVERLVPHRDVQVVVCDDTGLRARLAAKTLERIGFTRVGVLDGGINRWASENRSTEWGINVPSKDFGEMVEVARARPDRRGARASGVDQPRRRPRDPGYARRRSFGDSASPAGATSRTASFRTASGRSCESGPARGSSSTAPAAPGASSGRGRAADGVAERGRSEEQRQRLALGRGSRSRPGPASGPSRAERRGGAPRPKRSRGGSRRRMACRRYRRRGAARADRGGRACADLSRSTCGPARSMRAGTSPASGGSPAGRPSSAPTTCGRAHGDYRVRL